MAALALALLLSISTGALADSKMLLYTSVPLELATNFADQFMKANKGTMVTAIGRAYALDRSGGYREKTQVAYRALVTGEGREF